MAHALDYLIDHRDYPQLPHHELVRLARRRDRGDDLARERMILHNLRLARHFAHRYGGHVLDADSALSAALLGLTLAVDGWDWRRGVRFSVYAAIHIRRAIDDEMSERAIISLPASVRTLLRTWKRAVARLKASVGREPTAAEVSALSAQLGFTAEQHADVLAADLAQRVQPLRAVMAAPETDATGGQDRRWQQVREAMPLLTTTERFVISRLYGLDDQDVMNCCEIGSQLGRTADDVWAIGRQALSKLRHALRPGDHSLGRFRKRRHQLARSSRPTRRKPERRSATEEMNLVRI